MDSLKGVQELKCLLVYHSSPFLSHFFDSLDANALKAFELTLTHCRLSDIDTADYRSAYGQLCDWLYGWKLVDGQKDGQVNTKTPRPIDFKNETEKAEIDRLLKTFETLFHIGRRTMNRQLNEIESMLPRIGQGLKIMTTTTTGSNEASSPAPKSPIKDASSVRDSATKVSSHDSSTQRIAPTHRPPRSDNMRKSNVPAEITVSSMRNWAKKRPLAKAQNAIEPQIGSLIEQDNLKFHETPPAEESLAVPIRKLAVGSVNVLNGLLSKSNSSHNMLHTNSTSEEGDKLLDKEASAAHSAAVRQDLDEVYGDIDKSIDFTLITMSTAIIVLSLAELLQNVNVYQKFMNFAHDIAAAFLSNGLRAVYHLIQRELDDPEAQNLTQLRLLSFMSQLLDKIIRENGSKATDILSFIPPKLEVLHYLLTATDIQLFSPFVLAHSDGVKCAALSTEYKGDLWLTGGYDGLVKIHGLNKMNTSQESYYEPICHAIFAGHHSIVTSVSFALNDSQIVSSSFDGTIRIWSSSTAHCERILRHPSAVLDMDVTFDLKWVISACMDGKVYIWDGLLGQHTCILDRHQDAVKCVRFSKDGRYFATGSMDRRIFIYETRGVASGKFTDPTRSVDVHLEGVLDLDMNGTTLASVSRDCTLKLTDIMTGREIGNQTLGFNRWACTVRFSLDGELVAAGTFDNHVLLFTSQGIRLRDIRIFNLGVLCIRFNEDYLAVGSTDGCLQKIYL